MFILITGSYKTNQYLDISIKQVVDSRIGIVVCGSILSLNIFISKIKKKHFFFGVSWLRFMASYYIMLFLVKYLKIFKLLLHTIKLVISHFTKISSSKRGKWAVALIYIFILGSKINE